MTGFPHGISRSSSEGDDAQTREVDELNHQRYDTYGLQYAQLVSFCEDFVIKTDKVRKVSLKVVIFDPLRRVIWKLQRTRQKDHREHVRDTADLDHIDKF